MYCPLCHTPSNHNIINNHNTQYANAIRTSDTDVGVKASKSKISVNHKDIGHWMDDHLKYCPRVRVMISVAGHWHPSILQSQSHLIGFQPKPTLVSPSMYNTLDKI